jgi:hypothetical protein
MVDGPNLYPYVSGNPLRFHDPSGMAGNEATISADWRSDTDRAADEHRFNNIVTYLRNSGKKLSMEEADRLQAQSHQLEVRQTLGSSPSGSLGYAITMAVTGDPRLAEKVASTASGFEGFLMLGAQLRTGQGPAREKAQPAPSTPSAHVGPPVAGSGGTAAETLEFVRIPGMVQTPMTAADHKAWRRSVRENREVSVSTWNGVDHLKVGTTRTNVDLILNSEVSQTVHTHIRSKVAFFSDRDIELFRSVRCAPDTTHSVIGDKWPQTRREIADQGLQQPPLSPIKFSITQQQLDALTPDQLKERVPIYRPAVSGN